MTPFTKWQPASDARPLVKICGLTRVDNALACAEAGADIIGLVFFPKSPRDVSKARAGEITRALPGEIPTCGVFVDADYDTLMATVDQTGIRIVQLHGSESPDLATRMSEQGLVVVKAFFAAREPGLEKASEYPDADFCLAEYGRGILPGGNAESWDYGLAKGFASGNRLMLAGGLTPENVSIAVRETNPGAVDISSGVEASPGIKDIEKVSRFIQNAKSPA
ncbi:MAG TPA: phosphoribosylanthranilate isomerase [Desulfobacteraceae bacterium]|nr:phosphoribosylanthranilate isomerase [Desulfobacteraceae bacterium]